MVEEEITTMHSFFFGIFTKITITKRSRRQAESLTYHKTILLGDRLYDFILTQPYLKCKTNFLAGDAAN